MKKPLQLIFLIFFIWSSSTFALSAQVKQTSGLKGDPDHHAVIRNHPDGKMKVIIQTSKKKITIKHNLDTPEANITLFYTKTDTILNGWHSFDAELEGVDALKVYLPPNGGGHLTIEYFGGMYVRFSGNIRVIRKP